MVEQRVVVEGSVVVDPVEPVGLVPKIQPSAVRLATSSTDRHSFSTSVVGLLPDLARRVHRARIR